SQRAATVARHAAAGASRRRAPASDSRPAAPPHGPDAVPARAARAHASWSIPRSADVARDSRSLARCPRALAWIHRGNGHVRRRDAGGAGAKAPTPPTAIVSAEIALTLLTLELPHEVDERFDAGFGERVV